LGAGKENGAARCGDAEVDACEPQDDSYVHALGAERAVAVTRDDIERR
jgi:hypothetical protein